MQVKMKSNVLKKNRNFALSFCINFENKRKICLIV